jgi:hypothetical protein
MRAAVSGTGHLARRMGGPRSAERDRVHDQDDASVVQRGRSDQWGRLDHADAAWRAVPGPCRKRIEHEARAPARSTCSLDSARVEVAGLAEVPTHRGRAGGRPRLGGTPVGDESVAAGCLRDWLWSVAPAKGCPQREASRDQYGLEGARDQRNWDLAAEYGRYVPASLIFDVWVAVGGGNGTTAGCVAPDRNGLVHDGRASKPGTAARSATKFGSDPNPAISTRARTIRAGLTHEIARLVRDAVRPEPGTARQRTGFGSGRVPRNAPSQVLRAAESYPHTRDRRHCCPPKIK